MQNEPNRTDMAPKIVPCVNVAFHNSVGIHILTEPGPEDDDLGGEMDVSPALEQDAITDSSSRSSDASESGDDDAPQDHAYTLRKPPTVPEAQKALMDLAAVLRPCRKTGSLTTIPRHVV